MNKSEVYSTLPNKAPNDFELQVLDDDANYKSTVERFEFEYGSIEKKKKLIFFIINNLLTDAECQHYINESERAGYTPLDGYQISYRSNDRVTIVSQSLSTLLFKRIYGYFPELITHHNDAWKSIGLNEVFRFCRYGSGGVFGAHRDTYFSRSARERSFMTINIYLNDTDAGCTRFLNPTNKEVIFECQPKTGKALVFLHNEYHDGDVLRSGSKYLMRTDLMYQLEIENEIQTDCSNDKRTQAKKLYAQASEFEEKGQYNKAVQYYKKAINMWPTIEQEMND
ncbi:unnamed protein product [Rotaria sp. Silwood2]|nr:unnamed protein product [Rotaria sp. Silwood2]CAF3138638.1 unnamed protein product [Rotaria sp. Silwood2]CAF3438563.1 unnamed protein product [Rotaria sp. Silwood2]CAF4465051.1 unnamed protein product [Rotaria sp. Silwood2]CAF4505923.1 unnamed protein product [Rotaria sp. Silwood2]